VHVDGRKKNLHRSSFGPRGIQLFEPTSSAATKLKELLNSIKRAGIKQALLAKDKGPGNKVRDMLPAGGSAQQRAAHTALQADTSTHAACT
jgi:hypothetical protein